MRSKVLFSMILIFGLQGVFSVPVASANDWDRAATIVFKSPTEIPGQVLPAGMYVFKLLDDDLNRHVVQVWNADQTKLVATVLATTRSLLAEAPAGSLILFEDRGKDKPNAVKVWFHPGSFSGEEFSYPAKKK